MTVSDITPVVLVTGPTRGLGRDLTLALAQRKVHLLLAGRDIAATRSAADDAMRRGASSATPIALDLTSFASVQASTTQLGEAIKNIGLPHLTHAVANAGIQMGSRLQTTADGLETTFGVNVVGNHLLLQRLQPLLAPNAHVVVVGSGTHFGDPVTKVLVAAPRWASPSQLARAETSGSESKRAGQWAYSTSKLGVNYLVHELNRRWPLPFRANVYDPGLMPATGLARDLPPIKQWAWNHVMPALRVLPGVATTEHSAEQLAKLTLGETHASARNEYIEIGKLTKASTESFNTEREHDLWEYCENVTK